ncbi:MAG: MazG nucleotide pyrophosphohydrolase domain-containing protein [Abyssibacter sp.]|uniref:MazG nucleotide pyrophosphohydrolase domain-containing protein n=1 Tax=Abyssibacter sp. TaxID=2320200 RepID=UPI002EA73980|nr:MazG nucleotide pyrophosphohydrolase domain-containing protein [Pseudomonadota bacterium]
MLDPLARAAQLQHRAAAKGFDWPDAEGVWAKVREELDELAAAGEDAQHRAEELGDLLFAVVNLARHLGVEPTEAMLAANAKFERRFAYVEQVMAAADRPMNAETLDEMDAAWEAAKRAERSPV